MKTTSILFKKFYFLILFILFLVPNLKTQAQIQFQETPTPPTPSFFDGIEFSSIAFADIDADGDQDVLITGQDSSNQAISKLYTNDGSGSFTEVSGTPFDGVLQSSIAFADVDADGDQDVLITGDSSSGPIAKLYTNDGSGSFTEVSGTPFDGVFNSSIAFADVDADGDQDVLITGSRNSGLISKLYTNDGNGSFTEVSGTPFEGVLHSSIAFADVDADGDQDVLITGLNISFQLIAKLYTNDGSGSFTEVSGTPFDGVFDSSIAFADVDADGDQDVLITGSSNSGRSAKLYTNDGNGSFTEVSGTPFDGVDVSSVAFADVDADGDQDVLITGRNSPNQRIAKLYINDGSGLFTEVIGTPFDGVSDSSIAFADVDADGDQDVFITGLNNSSERIAKLYTNITLTPCNAPTNLSVANTTTTSADLSWDAAASESAGYDYVLITDGTIPDASTTATGNVATGITSVNFTSLMAATTYDAYVRTNCGGGDLSDWSVVKNFQTLVDGNGFFIEASGTPFDGVRDGSIAFEDIDADGDQDILITGENSSNQRISKLYTNDGSGLFTEVSGTPFDGVSFSSIAFADVDADGDQDVLITGFGSPFEFISKLYKNDGNGSFTEVSGTPFDGVRQSSIAFADVDADGDQDVLITGQDSSFQPISKLYTNDGSGSFTEVSGTPFEGVVVSSIAFADVDADGDQDVLITGDTSSSRIAKLYTNDGNGSFAEVSGTPFDRVRFSSIAFADVDADGDQDVLITGQDSFFQRIAKLYTNDGSGLFTEVSGTPFDGVSSSSIAFADVDADGDQDVLITGRNSSNQRIAKLYSNDGSGLFTEVSGTPFDGVRQSSIAFADVDADGDQDVLITGWNNSDQYIAKLYTNTILSPPCNAPTNLSVANTTDTSADLSWDVAATESAGYEYVLITDGTIPDASTTATGNVATGITSVNLTSLMPATTYDAYVRTNCGGGNLSDWSVATSFQTLVDGSGLFIEASGTPFEGVRDSSIAFADVDADGDQDVLITGSSNSSLISKLYTNDGNGNFTEVSGTPFEGVSRNSIAFADVDADGDQDVLITGKNSSNQRIAKLYTNDGSGSFTEVSGTPFDRVDGSSVAFADVDGDGDQDVLITGFSNSGRIAKLYTNDGSGSFTEVSGTPFDGVVNGSIAFADADADGDQDVLITGSSNTIRIAKLYTNDGNGSFTEVLGTPFDGVEQQTSIAFADVDGDGDQDVLITGFSNSGRIAKLYTNDGNGSFTEVSGTPFDGVDFSSIAFADVDADGDQDVLITGDSSSGRIAKLYTNDSSGSFTEVSGTPFDGVRESSIAFTDVDGDGDQDVVITGLNSSNQRIAKLYTNTTLSPCNAPTNLSVANTTTSSADLSWDASATESAGYEYVLITDGTIPDASTTATGNVATGITSVNLTGLMPATTYDAYVRTNCGGGQFSDWSVVMSFQPLIDGSGLFIEISGTPFDGVSNSSIAFADVDADGDQDILITGENSSGQFISKLYTNDGSGSFTEVSGTPFDGVVISSIAFADVDTDGDQDVLITGLNSSNQRIAKLYTNDGSGSFILVSGTPFDGVRDGSIAFADVDADGDQDVLITGQDSSNQRIAKLYINDGSGSFTEVSGTPFDGVTDGSIAFADVDADGDQDVLITGSSNSGRISKLYTNDGSGSFTEVTGTSFDSAVLGSIAFADVDADGDQDVLITGFNSSNQRISKLYTNDGSGSFTEVSGTPFDEVFNSSIAFADVDADGDQDVLITGQDSSDQPIAKLYANNGSGLFTEVLGTPFDGVGFSSIAFADVDADGDQDVLITGENNSNQRIAKLYTNTTLSPCNAPTNLSVANTTTTSADLSWDAAASESAGYDYVLITDGTIPDALTTATGNVATGIISVNLTSLMPATTYDAYVRTNCGGGQFSDWSVVKKFQTLVDGSGLFIEASGTPFDGVRDSSIAFADVNADGDQDVLITGFNISFQRIAKLYTNDGNGSFIEVSGTPFDGVSRSSIAFADVDADGDQDVLITGQDSSFQPIAKLYTNDGSGSFTEVLGTPFDGVAFGSIAFTDVDADDDQDVLITGQDSSNQRIAKLYTNDGNGSFTEVSGTPFDGVWFSSIAFADVDADGDQDVLITGRNSSNQRIAKLYTNDGSGLFTEVLGTPFDGVAFGSIAFTDVDADDDQDVLITGLNSSNQRIAKLYTNDGSGSFIEVSGTPFNGVRDGSIAFADVDADGDQDVLITGSSNSGRIAKLYSNDGSGLFTEVLGTPFDGVGFSSIAFADVDADGDQDVLITGENNSNQRIAKLYTNTTLSPCNAPTNLSVANTTTTSADLSWDAAASESAGYDYVLITDGTIPDALTTATGNVATGITSVNLTSLMPATTYDAYVRTNCGGGDLSDWSAAESFTTLTTPPTNDDLCGAIALTIDATSAGDAYTNSGATAQTDEPLPTCFSNGLVGTVWFTFVAPVSGSVEVTTDIPGGTLGNTEIAVYEAPTDCADLTTLDAELGCNQDIGSPNLLSTLDLSGLTPGATYYIQVDQWDPAPQKGTFGIEVSEATLRTASFDDNNFSFYPNPAENRLNLKTTGQVETVKVYNILGQEVMNETPNTVSPSLNVEALQVGTYIMNVTIDGSSANFRFIKE